MTTIRLHNSLTRKKEEFTPLDPKNVRMYVCGPTVYDRAHLGNARPVLVFDVLYRLLRHVYGPDHVTYVRNFTDVDDRINETALKRKQSGSAGTLEQLIAERSEETIGWYHDDMDALGALRPDHEPRATQYIAQMIEMTQGLIDKDFAYPREGHVLFRVRNYAEYGALSGRSVDDMIAGARVEVAPFKEDPMDFVLWKPSTDDLPGWDSPWGRGRPGWHIECSAMAKALLGDRFDIHGGGNDLLFPHHENEIAQSCCANDTDQMAQVWMHNEMLQVEGKKMSKSLGNFFTVRDLLDQGVPGEVIRFVMLSTHYRSPMDWTAEKAAQAEKTLRKWWSLVEGVQPGEPQEIELQPLSEDLNTSDTIQRLRAMATALERGVSNPEHTISRENFLASARVLGFLQEGRGDWAKLKPSIRNIRFALVEGQPTIDEIKNNPEAYPKEVESIKNSVRDVNRAMMRQADSFLDTVSLFMDQIKDFGVEFSSEIECASGDQVFDRQAFECAKQINISAMLNRRQNAKKNRDYKEADRIRNDLAEMGFRIIDTAEGAKWLYDA